MIYFRNFPNFFEKISSRCFTTNVYEKTLTVPTFCKLLINVPYNINLTPLDVYEHANCDKILIKIINKNFSINSFQCIQNDNEIIIKDCNNENLTCDIQAPIKADLNIKTTNGDVKIANFNGDNIEISTENGNVSLDKYHGENLKILSRNGNVDFRGIIQASDIDVRILENGCISTEKLQGLRTKLQTNIGNINVNSSYCNESEFSTQNGDLILKNIHKRCKVMSQFGNIKIVGMDGQLDLYQKNGNSEIQFSQINDFSKIHIENGELQVGISENCRENVKIRSNSLKIDATLEKFERKLGNDVFLSFSNGDENLFIDCENCPVFVKSASWSDMFSIRK